MNKCFGFVSFYKDEDIKEGDVVNKETIIYPNIEDSLRFFNLSDDVVVTKVSSEESDELLSSEYYGYFNMKKTDKLKIEKVYSYEEIINIMSSGSVNEVQLTRFINSFRIKEEDKQLFRNLGCFVSNYLNLAQGEPQETKVKKYGQNNNKRC